MIIYWLIFFILLLFALFDVLGLKKNEAIGALAALSVGLFTISFIRWETGTDWIGYYSYFDHIFELFQDSEYEWGFARINEIIKLTFNNYTVLLFCLGIILFYFQTKSIAEYSFLPLVSLLFLWGMCFCNVFFIRQSIATVILFYAVRFIRNRDLTKFILFVFIAYLFHRTSLIFIFAYWIYHLEIKPSKMVIILICAVLFSGLIAVLLNSISGIFGPIIQYKLETYLSLGEEKEVVGSSSSFVQILARGIVNKLLIFFVAIFYLKRISVEPELYKGYLNLYWFGGIIYFATVAVSVVFIRFSFAFDMFQILIIPHIIYSIEERKEKLLFFILLSIFIAARFYMTLTGSYYDLYVPLKVIDLF